MASTETEFELGGSNPLDMIETMIFGDEWPYERVGEDELVISVKGNWCDYQIAITWRPEMETLHFSCSFDAKFGKSGDARPHRLELSHMLALVNEQLLLGHFDVWQEESALVYRHGMLLHGGQTGPEQCEALLQIAIDTCERFYPAFQFVQWGGHSAEEALKAAMIQTEGEA